MNRTFQIGSQVIKIQEATEGDYLSLTDLAKLVHTDSSRVISKWLEMLRTIEFLHTWESTYNTAYHEDGYRTIRMQAGVPNFYLSAKQWIKTTNAIGIKAKSGRGGGIFAHHLIALDFCSTMSAEFRFKVFKEYAELKQNEAERWLNTHAFFIQKIEDNALENNRLAGELKKDVEKLKGT